MRPRVSKTTMGASDPLPSSRLLVHCACTMGAAADCASRALRGERAWVSIDRPGLFSAQAGSRARGGAWDGAASAERGIPRPHKHTTSSDDGDVEWACRRRGKGGREDERLGGAVDRD
jgi:hypothetical protein